jgi:hypothetical protein
MPGYFLPVYAQPDRPPFVVSSALLPIPRPQLRGSFLKYVTAMHKNGLKLQHLRPEAHSGEWFNYLQERQKLRRARLLGQAGLPEAAEPLFI